MGPTVGIDERQDQPHRFFTRGEPAPWLATLPRLRALLPYAIFPLAIALAVAVRSTGGSFGHDTMVYMGGSLLIGLLILRQAITSAENRQLYDRLGAAYTTQGHGLARRVAELEWLRDVSRQVNTARTLVEVLEVTYEGCRGLGFDRVGINLFDYEAGTFEDWIGTDESGRKTWSHHRLFQLTPDSAVWRFPGFATALRGEDLYYTADAYADCPEELRYLYDGAPKHNIMVTLHAGDRAVGNISVDNLLSGRPIAREDAGPLLALANQVGTAVERARALEALEHQALYDPLTGLPNRSLLFRRLRQALRGAGQQHALLLVDLNRFKEVNDTLGHQAGDLLLQQVGERLQAAVRSGDTVARLGGDEFAVLLPGAGGDGAGAMAATLLEALDAPFVVEHQQLNIGASMGISLAPGHGVDQSLLLRHADVAMYLAKEAGSGYAVYDPDHDRHSRERLTLISDLRQALAQQQMMVWYQPLVDLSRSHIYGVEALVRWRHPERGFIPPAEFIPLAEQSGLIVPLTYWVLEQAASRQREWCERGLDLAMSVNLSMQVLHDRRLPDVLAALLQRFALPADRLTMEITESSLMADPDQVRAVLGRLHALGVRISVDDFGAGYTSLAYLRQWPVNEIKIDRSFIPGIDADTLDSNLLRSILAMVRELGLSAVAEGVETRHTHELLLGQGEVRAQGYYYSPALAPERLEQWIRASGYATQAQPPDPDTRVSSGIDAYSPA